MTHRPATLRLFQGLAVACLRRDADAARQGLRILSDVVESDREGEQILRLLVGILSPQERFWLGTLHGARVGLEDPGEPAAGKLPLIAA